MNYPDDLNPKKTEKEIPAALTDPVIRSSTNVSPESIARVANLSSQVNYQASIGNPLAVNGRYGMGSLATINGLQVGREIINDPSVNAISEYTLKNAVKTSVLHGAKKLLEMAPIIGDYVVAGSAGRALGSVFASPIGLMITPAQLNAGEADFLAEQNRIRFTYTPPTEEEMLAWQAEERAIAKKKADYEMQSKAILATAKSKSAEKKITSPEDNISMYFSQRAIR